MRPHELILDGFRSYSGPTAITWQGRRLVGIVGPIGSGKSSILDGIAFALYGRTPRVERDVRGLINQRRTEGKVALTFSVDGTVWKVVRALRRKGQSAHALYRVEERAEVEVADKAREVTDRITELLGLDFDAFRRSVLLAQNQFAGFLEATPGKRNDVLKGVFGFERLDDMRAAARLRRDEAAAGLAALERLREGAAADRRDLDQSEADRQEIAATVARLEGARGPVAAIDAEIAALGERRNVLEADRRRLAEAADMMPDQQEADRVLAAAAEAESDVAAAERSAAAAEEREEARRHELAAVKTATGGREVLDRAGMLLRQLGMEEEAAARAAEEESEAAAAARQAQDAAAATHREAEAAAAHHRDWQERLAAASSELEHAEAALHEATHRDLASTLRRDLHRGDVCPVCDQQVARVPAVEESGLEAARSVHATARSTLDGVRSGEAEAARSLVGIRAAAEAADREASRLQLEARQAAARAVAAAAAASATRNEVSALLDGAEDPESALTARVESLTEKESQLAEALAGSESARRALDRARTDAEGVRTRIDGLRTHLAKLAGRLGLHGLELAGGSAELREALGELRDAWIRETREIAESVDGLDVEMGEAQKRRRASLEQAGLGSDEDLGEATAAAREQKAALDERISGLKQRLADLDRLEADHVELGARRDRYQQLFDDLAPARFPAFLLDDRRRALAALGSERFEYLSDGWYRFTDDGEFSVIDLSAADRTRPASSLSGGETFLASLALALALAEIVVREGGRLDAFFLDEGFGSLDDEHIELAMAGIERLATEGPDRLVVVVSHVPGLRDRLEDLIVLAKDELTGDTIVRSGSAAPG